jgi:hypothetical protein
LTRDGANDGQVERLKLIVPHVVEQTRATQRKNHAHVIAVIEPAFEMNYSAVVLRIDGVQLIEDADLDHGRISIFGHGANHFHRHVLARVTVPTLQHLAEGALAHHRELFVCAAVSH